MQHRNPLFLQRIPFSQPMCCFACNTYFALPFFHSGPPNLFNILILIRFFSFRAAWHALCVNRFTRATETVRQCRLKETVTMGAGLFAAPGLRKIEPQQRAHSPQVLPDGSASRVGAKPKSRRAGLGGSRANLYSGEASPLLEAGRLQWKADVQGSEEKDFGGRR